jgi:selenocysteine lyase/cysteine desulfurase
MTVANSSQNHYHNGSRNGHLDRNAFDVDEARCQFPGLSQDAVAFNNAHGTVVYQGCIEAVAKEMASYPFELGSDDPRGKQREANLTQQRAELAAFMNAEVDELAFGQSTTLLLRSLGQALRPKMDEESEMIVSLLDHEASATSWLALAKSLGIEIKWWVPPPGDDPCLSLDTLRPLLSSKTRIVACNHVSNVVGTIHPIREIADLVHTIPGAVVVVDGVSYAPHRPIDVKALDVDFYCFSWYKVYGPHIAQLYGRREVQKRLITHISHSFLAGWPGFDWRLRIGMNTFELEMGLVPITRHIKSVGWDNIVAQETVLLDVLLSHLRQHPDKYRIFGETTPDPDRRVSLVTFKALGKPSRGIMNWVHQNSRFRIDAGSCFAPRPTHEVLKLDSGGLIRVSFVHYNTVQEVEEFCEVLEKAVTLVE